MVEAILVGEFYATQGFLDDCVGVRQVRQEIQAVGSQQFESRKGSGCQETGIVRVHKAERVTVSGNDVPDSGIGDGGILGEEGAFHIGMVHVSLFEIHHHFVAHLRTEEYAAAALSGHGRHHPDPGCTVGQIFVVVVFPIGIGLIEFFTGRFISRHPAIEVGVASIAFLGGIDFDSGASIGLDNRIRNVRCHFLQLFLGIVHFFLRLVLLLFLLFEGLAREGFYPGLPGETDAHAALSLRVFVVGHERQLRGRLPEQRSGKERRIESRSVQRDGIDILVIGGRGIGVLTGETQIGLLPGDRRGHVYLDHNVSVGVSGEGNQIAQLNP